MKSIKEIRCENFARAIQDQCNGNQTEAAARLDYSTPSLVSRYATGKKDIGDRAARKIEQVFGLAINWMDTDHSPDAVNHTPDATPIPPHDAQAPRRHASRVPVIGCAQLGENGWYEEVEAGADGYVETHSSDPDAYALRVRGDSMFPAIRDGWYVVVEPNGAPASGEYVAIVLRDGRKMVKEYLFRSADGLAVQSVNGGTRLTLGNNETQAVHPIGAVLMPSKHRDI
ncbi:Cro/Cl family transcriptional regulator [Bordetella bronchiseptica]|nr:Cro/Cl family transcriptional regulator [Bordetella bronchiseptica]